MWLLVLIIQIIHLLYHQITTNFDFFPFNNIKNYTHKQRIIESFVNAITMGFPVVATLLNNKNLIATSVIVLGITLLIEFFTWWYPYFWGAGMWWQEIYNKIHKHTIIMLPAIKNNPVPNLEHCILHTLTLITFVITLIYFMRMI